MLSVHAIEKSEIYGHGQRAVVWFSGCTIRCPGCINSHLFERSSGEEMSVSELLSRLILYTDLTGVTFIGGEPMDQGEELLELSRRLVDAGLDIVLFTGYEPEELSGWQTEVYELCSVAICGRFILSERDTGLLLRGSRNQRLIVREQALWPYYSDEARQVDVIITPDSTTFLGFPEDFLE